jgi:hypothetical protein
VSCPNLQHSHRGTQVGADHTECSTSTATAQHCPVCAILYNGTHGLAAAAAAAVAAATADALGPSCLMQVQALLLIAAAAAAADSCCCCCCRHCCCCCCCQLAPSTTAAGSPSTVIQLLALAWYHDMKLKSPQLRKNKTQWVVLAMETNTPNPAERELDLGPPHQTQLGTY